MNLNLKVRDTISTDKCLLRSQIVSFLFPENKNSMLEAEIRSLQRRLVRRDNEILKQERELHKLRVRDLGQL